MLQSQPSDSGGKTGKGGNVAKNENVKNLLYCMCGVDDVLRYLLNVKTEAVGTSVMGSDTL